MIMHLGGCDVGTSGRIVIVVFQHNSLSTMYNQKNQTSLTSIPFAIFFVQFQLIPCWCFDCCCCSSCCYCSFSNCYCSCSYCCQTSYYLLVFVFFLCLSLFLVICSCEMCCVLSFCIIYLQS